MAQSIANAIELIRSLGSMSRLFLPVRQLDRLSNAGGEEPYRFQRWDGREPDLASFANTTVPPKELLFPQSEDLYSYRDAGGLDFHPATVDEGERIVLGVRPCDCAGIARLDRVFLGEPADGLYGARRSSLTVIGLACNAPPYRECFCTSVGLSPDSTEGMDLRATLLDDQLLLEVVTAKGADLMEKIGGGWMHEASEEEVRRAQELRSASAARVARVPMPAQGLPFEHPLWKAEATRCLGCGTCAFLCPTCHCFTIEHLGNGRKGRVIRSWDSCQFPAYSLEASGFNPRPNKEERLRQRLMHKFAYFADSHGVQMCVGCGRCIRLCPVEIDIREILAALATA